MALAPLAPMHLDNVRRYLEADDSLSLTPWEGATAYQLVARIGVLGDDEFCRGRGCGGPTCSKREDMEDVDWRLHEMVGRGHCGEVWRAERLGEGHAVESFVLK